SSCRGRVTPPASWASASRRAARLPASMTPSTASACVRSSLPARNARRVNSPGPAARAPASSSRATSSSTSGGGGRGGRAARGRPDVQVGRQRRGDAGQAQLPWVAVAPVRQDGVGRGEQRGRDAEGVGATQADDGPRAGAGRRGEGDEGVVQVVGHHSTEYGVLSTEYQDGLARRETVVGETPLPVELAGKTRDTSPKRERGDTLSPRWRVGLVSRH